MSIKNWDSIESDRDCNYYLIQYRPVTEYPADGIFPGIKLETFLIPHSFPVKERNVRSILFESIYSDMPEMETEYGLVPFRMQVQSVSRTFIDKIFVLCDLLV